MGVSHQPECFLSKVELIGEDVPISFLKFALYLVEQIHTRFLILMRHF